MPRQVLITLPPNETDGMLNTLKNFDGVIGLRVQRGASLKPPGDVIEADVLNRHMDKLSRLLDENRIGFDPGNSVSSTLPASLVSSGSVHHIARDTSESSWEEIELTLGRESNMTANNLAVMMFSGFICIIGIGTGTPHLVIAAMVIAPGFEPLTRIALGLVLKNSEWRRGLVATLNGYLILLAGGAAGALLLIASGQDPFRGTGSFMDTESMASYWTTIQITSVSVSAVASLAGAILVAAHRSVLTAGVMIALALIPSAALFGAGLASLNMSMALDALTRWIMEAALIIASGSVVFGWKRYHLHKRTSRT